MISQMQPQGPQNFHRFPEYDAMGDLVLLYITDGTLTFDQVKEFETFRDKQTEYPKIAGKPRLTEVDKPTMLDIANKFKEWLIAKLPESKEEINSIWERASSPPAAQR